MSVYLPTCPDSLWFIQMANRETSGNKQKITAFSLSIVYQKVSEYSRKCNLIKDEIIFGTLKGQIRCKHYLVWVSLILNGVVEVVENHGIGSVVHRSIQLSYGRNMGDSPPCSPLGFCENDKNIRGDLEPPPDFA